MCQSHRAWNYPYGTYVPTASPGGAQVTRLSPPLTGTVWCPPLVQISFHSCLSRASTASGSLSGSYAPPYASFIHPAAAAPITPYATPLPAPAAAAAAASSSSSSLSPFLPRLPLHLLARSTASPDTPPLPAQRPSATHNEEEGAEEIEIEEEAVAQPDAASPPYSNGWLVENQPAEGIVTAASPPQFPSLLNMEPELAASLEPLFLRMLRIIWVRPALLPSSFLSTLASTSPRARTRLGSWLL